MLDSMQQADFTQISRRSRSEIQAESKRNPSGILAEYEVNVLNIYQFFVEDFYTIAVG